MTRRRASKAESKPGTQARASEEKGLWDRVKRTVDPLDADQRALYSQALAEYLDGPIDTSSVQRPHHHASGAMKHHVKGHPEQHHPHPAHPEPGKTKLRPRGPATPPLIDLDRKARTRIARGRTPIDARVDLHGLRQHEAQDVLRGFIWRAHQSGHRTVLVITGKGTRQKDPHPHAPPWAMGSGILRKAVPGWLSSPDMRAAVLSFEPASPSHGGDGALYVRLRARRA